MTLPVDKHQVIRRRFDVTGRVQGVGFRPFVYNLAHGLGLGGFVVNTASGAIVEVEGADDRVKQFRELLTDRPPPLARIDHIVASDPHVLGEREFVINASRQDGSPSAEVTVDTTVCDDCLREMLDPNDRRFRYPFINCTNCGPRYTIVKAIPYDRPNTTMHTFEMCPACRHEYEDPTNRRFHAQPIACADCGPKLTLVDQHGRQVTGDPIARTAELLRDGQVVAIKGLGGFHLAVDATNHDAVIRLRRLKKRDYKPFALMAADLAMIETMCLVDDDSRAVLEDIARPIVILSQHPDHVIAPQVAPGMDTFGVFLPYAPHHYLLFAEGLGPLVMTSGNITDEPLAKDNDEAMHRLGHIADAFLLHDRPIYRRVDDSVVVARGDGLTILRRSRGFVPQSADLGDDCGHAILAVGAELKNTVTLVKGSRAIISEHIGDLKDATVFEHFKRTIDHLCGLFEHRPDVIVADRHPDYLSTRYALEQLDLTLFQVQHHHAHVVACMAEHGLNERVVGLSCDGVGLGDDGAVWGCEVLVADRAEFRRAGHLKYFSLPGGDAAAKQTFRPALSLLVQAFGGDIVDSPIARRICPDRQIRRMVVQMIERGINCPQTSSLGRLFDAVAAMTELTGTNHYEGQAPMLLEARATGRSDRRYDYELDETDDMLIIDPTALVRGVRDDAERGDDVGVIADKFHNTVADFLAQAAIRVGAAAGSDKVVLTGGCFANRYLSTRVNEHLHRAGLQCFEHRAIPCGDGGISLGQAACAAAQLLRMEKNDEGDEYVSGPAGTSS